ncbi:hypothetical protein [Pseudomonas sp. AP-1]|uniref:hypothetical protein n=1 Tax=Pseudomonas sp. AP-1 TaxID=3231718 RepID=UPI0035AE39B1
MSEDDHQDLQEMLKHWKEAINQMHFQDRARAIERAEEAEKQRSWQAFKRSATGTILNQEFQLLHDSSSGD